ncbi:MAG: ABC transporter substrate-binding protein [Micavibrio sp.]|nr:MAG: ABC transporter substrate-binding protein [Micavibrio sp.]
MIRILTGLLAVFLMFPSVAKAEEGGVIGPLYGVAMHGEPKYGEDFTHFDYVNPDAPKGGEIRMSAIGTFDSLNPYILRGNPAIGSAMIYQSLLDSSDDEPFSQYGQIAESFEMDEDRSWVRFYLREEARWHDGKPLTAEDIKWSFRTLMEKGRPFFRSYYANVERVEIENPHQIRFVFNVAGNRELPLIIGQIPVMPKHYWEAEDREFNRTTLEPPPGSGPYKIADVQPGRRIVYERVKDWWAADLPVNKGQYNFDRLVFIYYRDQSVAHQAFLAGEYDYKQETVAREWATGYDAPAVRDGRIIKRKQEHQRPQGLQAFAYNTRRPFFADRDVRKALAYAFDFEWSNRQFAHGTYVRSRSYFSNSELESSGLPEGRELEILEALRDLLPEEVFTKEYTPPETDGSGRGIRGNLRRAAELLDGAGWALNRDTGIREKDGTALRFEILLVSPAFERWVAPFIQNLERIGVKATMRVVDTSQYQARVDDFDFDMIVRSFGQSLSPGNEQRDFWHSEKADERGSYNIMGIKNPAIDALIDKVIQAPDRDELVYRTRALDRVLLWNHYVIPQWHIGYFRLAYWDKFGFPETPPKYDTGAPHTWWYDAEKARKVQDASRR